MHRAVLGEQEQVQVCFASILVTVPLLSGHFVLSYVGQNQSWNDDMSQQKDNSNQNNILYVVR